MTFGHLYTAGLALEEAGETGHFAQGVAKNNADPAYIPQIITLSNSTPCLVQSLLAAVPI